MEEPVSEIETAESANGHGVSFVPNEKSAKRSYKQIYRKDWENNPIFQGKFIFFLIKLILLTIILATLQVGYQLCLVINTKPNVLLVTKNC